MLYWIKKLNYKTIVQIIQYIIKEMTTYDKTEKYNIIKRKLSSHGTIESEKMLIDYMVYFSSIDELFTIIDRQQKESRVLFEKLQISIFDSEKIETQYKSKIIEVEKNMESARQLFTLKKDICKKYSNVHDVKIIENMYRQKLNKFESIITNHQKIKSLYIDFYKRMNKETENMRLVEQDLSKSVCDESKSDMEYNSEQTQEYSRDMEIFAERNREIETMVKSITDLNQIFKDLSIMVNEQSESIDRIDLVMGEVVTKTESGIKELNKTREEQKKCTIQ
jgi:hypothetical protein